MKIDRLRRRRVVRAARFQPISWAAHRDRTDQITAHVIPQPGITYITVAAPPVAYTMQAAAAACGPSVSTLRAAVIRGPLAARWVGSKLIIRHEDLAEWVGELSADDPANAL
ncbi:helix-turn-helix domain-containing protein [Cryobacterium sp. Y50]|uniref:helix-turn-helix domain-containing protein n=1 Tax=Cryobacterium sp. Y50 TaxID=2048286 RepID=UPI0011B09E68|nr:helix-turn-helix domain-containing protein [Cryobacterium sp. Y50]